MSTKRPIYYDTETTGTKPNKDRIIEIAAYDPIEKRTFVSFVNPGMLIPPEATAISNITDEMVKDAPGFLEVGKAFVEFCSYDAILIAHNNDAFDKLFLDEEFRRAGLTIPSWQYLDTLKWSRKYRPDLPRHSLQSLRELFGIPANHAHRALDDVIVLHEVFSQMIDDLSFDVVLQLLEQPKEINRMPFGKHQGKPLSQIPKDYVLWLKSSGAFDKSENAPLKESFEKLGVL
jgi:DNA polymerase-3 subunit epsilon